MKILEILNENEYIPRSSNMPRADEIAQQFVRVAEERYSRGGGDTYEIEIIAKKLAEQFHKKISAAINRELKYKEMKTVSSHGESGSFRATA